MRVLILQEPGPVTRGGSGVGPVTVVGVQVEPALAM